MQQELSWIQWENVNQTKQTASLKKARSLSHDHLLVEDEFSVLLLFFFLTIS